MTPHIIIFSVQESLYDPEDSPGSGDSPLSQSRAHPGHSDPSLPDSASDSFGQTHFYRLAATFICETFTIHENTFQ